MDDLPALITAASGAVGLLGTGIGFLWRRVEKGLGEVKGELEKCQQRERKAAEREMRLELKIRDQAGKHLTVIELLWQEIERRSRGAPNPVLGRARELLDDLKKEAGDE